MREEQEFNVRFVQSVERHRCIYDYTLTDYADKEKQEESWIEIAEEMGSTAADCKERWRNLRCSLTRHLKTLGKEDIRKKPKPYYLTEHMQFIVPFTKTRNRAILPLIQDNLDSEDLFTNDKLICDDDEDEGLDLMQPPKTVVAAGGKRLGSPDGESSESFFKSKRPKEDSSDGDPDLNFFISLLPDVRCMDSSQKRQMKMGVLKLIDEILT